MKFLFFSLVFAQSAMADSSCYVGHQRFHLGDRVEFYYVDEAAKIGPGYTCRDLSRVRTCEALGARGAGGWSIARPTCQTEDSGGCVDYWVDLLPDSAFSHSQCQ